jgi:hypothetical protein
VVADKDTDISGQSVLIRVKELLMAFSDIPDKFHKYQSDG